MRSISNRRRSIEDFCYQRSGRLPLYSGHYPLAPVSPTGIIICMHPANKKRYYSVTPYLIGWRHIQNDPCSRFIRFRYNTTTYNSTLHSTLQWLSWKVEHSSFTHRTMDYGNPHDTQYLALMGWSGVDCRCHTVLNPAVAMVFATTVSTLKRPVSSQMFSIKYDPMASWLNYVLNAKLMGIFT